MSDNVNNGNPDPFSRESGGPAHNTTLDVLDGRLPGADQTSNPGQRLRVPGETLPEGGPRNRENLQDTGDQWVTGVLDQTLAMRLGMGVLPPHLATLDKTVVECLSALGFGDAEAAAWLLLLPQLEEILQALQKLLKTQGTGNTIHHVRHLVGVWLSRSTMQYAARLGQLLLQGALQGEPPPALGDIFTSPAHATASGWPHSIPTHLLGSAQQSPGLLGPPPVHGAGSLFGPPAVAGGFTSHNNFESNPAALLGADGAGQRAGFCSTAPADAPQGASSTVRPTSQPVGAESRAQLPAFAGGLSSSNNTSSNLPALGAEGAVLRAGFCGSAPTGASQGASAAVRPASQPRSDEARAQPPALDVSRSSGNNLTSSNPYASAPTGGGAEGSASRTGSGVVDLRDAFSQAAPRPAHSFVPPPHAGGLTSMTLCRPLGLSSQLEGAAPTTSAGRLGPGPHQNAQLSDTAAHSLTTGFGSQLDVLHNQPAAAPLVTPRKSFPGIKQGLEAEPSRFSETRVESSSSAAGGPSFPHETTPYQAFSKAGGAGRPESEFLGHTMGSPPRSRLPSSGAPPKDQSAPLVIHSGEEARFHVYDSARTLPVGSHAMALLSATWVEAGLAMKVGPVDGQGFALVWAKNNTQNLLILSPSPQALLNECGVQPPEVQQRQAEPTPASTFELPQSLADIQATLRRLPEDGWMQAAEEMVGMAAEEDADIQLDEVARQLVRLHYAHPVLNGATVLHAVTGMRNARLSGRAGYDFPTFRDAFQKVLRRLTNIATTAQRKQQLRQPVPASAVRFTEPVVATPLGQQPIANLFDTVRSWQAVNQPGAPQVTQESLVAFMQHAQPPQFGAYDQSGGGAGANFAQQPQHNRQAGQQSFGTRYESPQGGGFGGAHFGGPPPGSAGGEFGAGAGLRQAQPTPPAEAPDTRQSGALEVSSPSRTNDLAVEALLELARTSQMSFSSKVGEQRKVLMEVRCQRWYSGSPFAGYSAQQDIKPFLEVLERVSITEHALAFPPHREGAFRQNLAVYGVARCDTLEKVLENLYWFSLAGIGQVTVETATSKALAILMLACEGNKEISKRSATLNSASRTGGETGMLQLITLLDDELLPLTKQKATQEFKDLKAGDDDKLADVLLQFDNVGKRCGKTEAEVIEAFIDLLRKLCEGDDYMMWFGNHVAQRYVSKAADFTNATALYASLRDDLTSTKALREYRKERQSPAPARDRTRLPSASANALQFENDGMEETVEALANAALDSRVPPKRDPVTNKPRAVVPGPLNIPLIVKSGKLAQFNDIVLKRGTAGLDCQGCKHRKGGEFTAEYASRDAYRTKHGSVPYGDSAKRRIQPDEVIKHDLLHCLTLWRIVWDWVDKNEEDWEFCVPAEGKELQAITALMVA